MMVLFGKGGGVPLDEVKALRGQGLGDNEIIDELKGKGYSLEQINDALAQAAIAGPEEMPGPEGAVREEAPEEGAPPEVATGEAPAAGFPEELHGRIEEIAESIIDEKWELLIEEVKKIVDWKDKVEEEVSGLKNEVGKLKEDFKELHQGVLGKLESYDEKMVEVGTELKAVGKVFKEVVPEFVENVKELKAVTKGVKKGRKK